MTHREIGDELSRACEAFFRGPDWPVNGDARDLSLKLAELMYSLGYLRARLDLEPESPAGVPGGDPSEHVSQRLLDRIRQAGGEGVSSSRLSRECFGGHVPGEQLRDALHALRSTGLVHSVRVQKTGKTGPPATLWFAGPHPTQGA